MQQHERSDRSRRQILDAALALFSTRGYRGTSIRDIGDAAGLSIGNVYHQFPDKEAIFQTLLEEYWTAIRSPEFPFNKELFAGAFPDNLKKLGRAARRSIQEYKPYVALIYVDVIEFEGSHIRRFYQEMASRFQAFLDDRPEIISKLRPSVSPLSAIMIVSRFLLYYYSVEILFNVPNHFGKRDDAVLTDIIEIFEHGILPASRKVRSKKEEVRRKKLEGRS
jgi:AcrR family transcriptional regulator